MAWDTFVYDNIKKQLVKEGFSEALAQGANHGADHYRRMSQASRKGMAFDDCLTRARQFALASGTKDEKPEKAGNSKKPRSCSCAAFTNLDLEFCYEQPDCDRRDRHSSRLGWPLLPE